MKCPGPFDLALLITVYLCAYTGQKQTSSHNCSSVHHTRTSIGYRTTQIHKDIFINFYRISLPNDIHITSHREASNWILMSRHRATCTASGAQGQMHRAMYTRSDAQGKGDRVRCTWPHAKGMGQVHLYRVRRTGPCA